MSVGNQYRRQRRLTVKLGARTHPRFTATVQGVSAGGNFQASAYLSCTQTYLALADCLRGTIACSHFCPACSQSQDDSNPGTLAIVETPMQLGPEQEG